MRQLFLSVFLNFCIFLNGFSQITYAEVNQKDYQRKGYGYSVCLETFNGRTPFFYSGGGFIVNPSYQELRGFCAEAMLKLGLGYMDEIDYWGIIFGIKGGGEFDDYNPEIVGYGIGGWSHISLNKIVSFNFDYTYGFNTKSQLYRGAINIFVLSINFI